jgi:hypothetical protein
MRRVLLALSLFFCAFDADPASETYGPLIASPLCS